MFISKIIMFTPIILIITSSPAFAEVVLKSRLDCIESLTPFTQKGSSTSFKFSENVKDMSLKEFSSALVGIDKRKNLMTLPKVRNGERGFYLFSDEASFWYPLPKLKKKGEFLPQYLKVENNLLSKSPLYLTYYDGVETSGAEYSNKSVGLSVKPETETSAKFIKTNLAAIKDSESETAFLDNFKGMLSTIHAVRERNSEKRNAKEKKQFLEALNLSLNNCSSSFKKSGDSEYLDLIKVAIEENKTDPAPEKPGISSATSK